MSGFIFIPQNTEKRTQTSLGGGEGDQRRLPGKNLRTLSEQGNINQTNVRKAGIPGMPHSRKFTLLIWNHNFLIHVLHAWMAFTLPTSGVTPEHLSPVNGLSPSFVQVYPSSYLHKTYTCVFFPPNTCPFPPSMLWKPEEHWRDLVIDITDSGPLSSFSWTPSPKHLTLFLA